MTNTLVFVRHAKSKVDSSIPIEDWVLTEDGTKSAEGLANDPELLSADILISSAEEKAYLTIKPLAERLNKSVTRVPELGEMKRPDGEKIGREKYEEMKVKMFRNLDYTELGWETANHALSRFQSAVQAIDKQYNDKKIIIASHGTVMTLYFCKLQNKMGAELFDRWHKLGNSVYGIVKDGKVVKDIV